mgnify:CR=1 FL=1
MIKSGTFTLSELRRLWADDGLTNAEIAAAIGYSERGVYSLSRKLGLPSRRLGPKVTFDQSLFESLWRAGVGAREIAALFGVNRYTLSNAAVRMGLPQRGGGWQPRMSLAQYREAQLARRMADSARREAGALLAAGMVDNPSAARRVLRRAA